MLKLMVSLPAENATRMSLSRLQLSHRFPSPGICADWVGFSEAVPGGIALTTSNLGLGSCGIAGIFTMAAGPRVSNRPLRGVVGSPENRRQPMWDQFDDVGCMA